MVILFAAEGAEARALRETLGLTEPLDGPWPIHTGTVGSQSVALLEAGVGKVAAAAAVAFARQRFQPNMALWVGVGGALNPALKTLDLVLCQDAVQYDVDITAFGRQPGELATGERFIPADAALNARVMRAAGALGEPLHLGRVGSADRFLADGAEAERVRQIFAADVVEMEGAAALWTAKRMGLPMTVIRAVTDGAGGDAPGAFEAFLDAASARLAGLVRAVIAS